MSLQRNALFALLCCVIASCSGDATGPEQRDRPTISGIVPDPILAGAEEVELVVAGSDFQPSSSVLWEGEPRPTTYRGPRELRARLGAGDVAYRGEPEREATITVRNLSGAVAVLRDPSTAESPAHAVSVASLGVVRVTAGTSTLGAIQGLDVRLSPVDGPGPAAVQPTDVDGSVSFVGLPAGRYALGPVPPDGSALSFVQGGKTLRVGQETPEIGVTFEGAIEPAAEVRGTVTVGDSDAPLEGATVLVETALVEPLSTRRPWIDSTATDGEGRYTLRSPPGNARIALRPSPWPLGDDTVAVGDLTLETGDTPTLDASVRSADVASCVKGTIRYGQTVEGDITGDDCVAGHSEWELWRLEADAGDFVEVVMTGRDAYAVSVFAGTTTLASDDGPPSHRAKRVAVRLPEEGGYLLMAESRDPVNRYTLTPRRTSRWTSLSAGGRHTCGLDPDGRAWCWGANGRGQLGNGTTTSSTTPVAVADGHTYQQLSAGGGHTCGVARSGDVFCWGENGEGQLGDGSTTPRSRPVRAASDASYEEVSASLTGSHTCALDRGGGAWCWGRNGSGQIGDGSTTDRSAPVEVAGAETYRSIAAGGTHTCAVAEDGSVRCWGANDRGQLGDGTREARLEPTPTAGDRPVKVVSAGAEHTCALDPDAESQWEAVFCWGRNDVGQIGAGSPPDDQLVPVQADFSGTLVLKGPYAMSSLTAAGHRTCVRARAFDRGYTARCWGGTSRDGGLGTNTGSSWLELSSVTLGGSESTHFACGVGGGNRLEDAAYCWGANESGQLGVGTREAPGDLNPVSPRP